MGQGRRWPLKQAPCVGGPPVLTAASAQSGPWQYPLLQGRETRRDVWVVVAYPVLTAYIDSSTLPKNVDPLHSQAETASCYSSVCCSCTWGARYCQWLKWGGYGAGAQAPAPIWAPCNIVWAPWLNRQSVIMRPSSLGGGRILRRTLSICPSVPLPLPLVTSFRPR